MEFQFRGLDKIGLQHENKNVEVPIRTDAPDGRNNAIEQAIRYYEVEGWIGSKSNCCNYHNFVRRETKNKREYDVYTVCYHRYVAKEK